SAHDPQTRPSERTGASPAEGRAPPAAEPSEGDAPADLPEEHRLIRAARRALPAEPAAALARVREHARRFPSGLLAEERELLRVSALAALDRRVEARRVAAAFARRWPSSAYAARVRELAGGDAP
ncbi:MAG TPA: hypothetical protein RMH99_21665, partial [Sandaracinaceae bacterium LLY-WYZ-13_1]|nr:hypothetical protein [Sandaracinaceae bacterium LLY-WYZ-13_1]